MTDEKTALERRQEPIDAQLQRSEWRRTDYAEGYHYNGAEEEGVQVDWAKWARAIFRRKRLIAAIVAIGGLSLFAAFRTRDAYQAYAVIYAGKEDTAVIKVREGDLVVQNDESLRTKMYLLQSNPLVEEVIVNLKLDRSEDPQSRRTLKETFGSLSEGVKKVFQGRRNISEPAPNMSDSLSKPTNVGAIDLVFSCGELATGAFRREFQTEPPGGTGLGRAIKELPVEPISETRLLKIAYTHPDLRSPRPFAISSLKL